jgi:uroporphyrinogen decarboxylase
MNSRERVRRILNHQEADRPAIDLGATRMTGTSAWSYRALKRLLGLPAERVRVFDLYQMLAEVEEPVLDAVGADFLMLPIDDLALGLDYGAWKPFTFWDGQTFDVPAGFAPRIRPDGALESPRVKDGPIEMRMPVGGRFFDLIPGERQDSFDIPHLDEPEWEIPAPFTDEYLRGQEERARELNASTDRAIVASPPCHAPQGYAGTYHWAMKMATEPAHCRDYMMRQGEAEAYRWRQYLQAVGKYVEVVNISGNDYGTQDREMFRPSLWGEFYVPAWRLVTDVIHTFPDVKTWIHCCGSVPNLIPYFIAAGVDILNPVQWTAAGMDLRTLKAKYGQALTFWGGAISTQRTFPFGTAEDVAREARDVLDVMAPGGGFVVNPIHNILAEVPVENIVALYRTAQNYRY